MAIRILMAATHHPPTATTPQGKAFHPLRLAKIAKQTLVWAKDAGGLVEGSSSSKYAVKFLNFLFCREGVKTLTSCQDTSASKPKLYYYEIPYTEPLFNSSNGCLYSLGRCHFAAGSWQRHGPAT
jgi:hypothetical protein